MGAGGVGVGAGGVGEDQRRAATAAAVVQNLAASRRDIWKRPGLSVLTRERLVYIGKRLLPAVLDDNRR